MVFLFWTWIKEFFPSNTFTWAFGCFQTIIATNRLTIFKFLVRISCIAPNWIWSIRISAVIVHQSGIWIMQGLSYMLMWLLGRPSLTSTSTNCFVLKSSIVATWSSRAFLNPISFNIFRYFQNRRSSIFKFKIIFMIGTFLAIT